MLHVLDRVMEALLPHLHVEGMDALPVHVMRLRANLWATSQESWRNIARTIVQHAQVVVSTASMRAKFNAGLVPGWPRSLLRGSEHDRCSLQRPSGSSLDSEAMFAP